jgi:hypothetical protein
MSLVSTLDVRAFEKLAGCPPEEIWLKAEPLTSSVSASSNPIALLVCIGPLSV